MVAKVEVSERGFNRRFVVTNRQDLTAGSCMTTTGRGQCENFVKAFKKDLAMDRLSCHRFLANQFRLFIHALAYVLILRLRDYLCGTPWHNLEIETLRRRLQNRCPGSGNFSSHLGAPGIVLSRTKALRITDAPSVSHLTVP